MSNILWRVYDLVVNQYFAVVSPTEPTQSPLGNPIDPEATVIIENVSSNEGYNIIESTLSDNRAVQILASNINGGIYMKGGIGGILVETTNSINLQGGAACSLTTTNGNIDISNTSGLVNINGSSGINIGNVSENSAINIGSSGNRMISLGNSLVDTFINTDELNIASRLINIVANQGDFGIRQNGIEASRLILSSSGTNNDAILAFSSGGIQLDSTNQFALTSNALLQLTSNRASGNDITLFTPNGGILINSGIFGVAIDSLNGLIAIGPFGNTGNIEVGNGSVARTIIIGNINSGTNLAIRTDQSIRLTQLARVALADSDANLTVSNLVSGIMTISPSILTTRQLTMPTAASIISNWVEKKIGDSINFTIINEGLGTALVISNTGITTYGNLTINSGTSGTFRIRFSNVTNTIDLFRL